MSKCAPRNDGCLYSHSFSFCVFTSRPHALCWTDLAFHFVLADYENNFFQTSYIILFKVFGCCFVVSFMCLQTPTFNYDLKISICSSKLCFFLCRTLISVNSQQHIARFIWSSRSAFTINSYISRQIDEGPLVLMWFSELMNGKQAMDKVRTENNLPNVSFTGIKDATFCITLPFMHFNSMLCHCLLLYAITQQKEHEVLVKVSVA